MRRRAARGALRWGGALLAAAAPAAARAHPLHTTITEVRVDRARGTVEARVRLFADDLGAVAGAAAVPASSGAAPPGALAYLAARFGATVGGAPLRFAGCGAERRADAVILCLRAAAPGPIAPGALVLRNAVLTERYADQVNVVRVVAGDGAAATLLLTRAATARAVR